MLAVIKQYPFILGFGFLCAFFTGIGQTFFVALFNNSFKTELDLTNSQLSICYSLATLSSGLLLPFIGRLLDQWGPRTLTIAAGLGLVLGSLFLGYADMIAGLAVGYFLVRISGQGSLSLISRTTVTKHFAAFRGRALSIQSLGYPLSEAVLPVLVAFLMAVVGFRNTWIIFAAVAGFLFIPFSQWLLTRIEPPERGEVAQASTKKQPAPDEAKLSEVLRDYRFYFLVPIAVFNPFILTSFFFHQMVFADVRGWSLELVASGFVAYGAARASGSFFIGPLIDRYSASRLLIFHMIPLVAGFFIYGFVYEKWAVFAYMGLAGLTVGTGSNLKSVVWAEFFGTKILGTINGLTTSLMMVSTAIGPLVLGALIDAQVNHDSIFLGFIAGAVFVTVLACVPIYRR